MKLTEFCFQLCSSSLRSISLHSMQSKMFVDIFRRFSFNKSSYDRCVTWFISPKNSNSLNMSSVTFSMSFYCAVVEWNQGQATWNAIVSIRMNSFMALRMHLRGFIFSVLLIKWKERANAHFVTSSIIILTSLDVVRTPASPHTRAYAHTHCHRQTAKLKLEKEGDQKFPSKLEKLFVAACLENKLDFVVTLRR